MLCPEGDCQYTAHLLCIAPLFTPPTSILPKRGQCPGCDIVVDWGKVIRGCYARKERSEQEQEDIRKQEERQLQKARRKKANVADGGSSQAISELRLESPTKRSRRPRPGRVQVESDEVAYVSDVV
jgi:structure-specific endonuclease subunit SLX1